MIGWLRRSWPGALTAACLALTVALVIAATAGPATLALGGP